MLEPLHTLLPAPVLTLAENAAVLVSWWKALILLIPIIPWAVLISQVFDKHAARFFLPRETWNTVHLCIGAVGFLVAFFMPVKSEWTIVISFFTLCAFLAIDIAVFMYVTNRDDRVPEEHRLKLDLSKLRGDREAKAEAKAQGKVELVIKSMDKQSVTPPLADTPEFATRVAAETLFIRAMDSRATQIDVLPTGKDGLYAAVLTVDSVRQQPETLPGTDAVRLIDFWKSAAKLDINDRRRKLVGDCTVERGDTKRHVRLMTSGSQAGMRLSMLLDPEKQVRRKAEALGLLEPQVAEIKAMVAEKTGVVLVASPPDQGRTTTFYSLVKMHDAYTSNVQTVEAERQDSLEGVRQNDFNPQAEDGPEYWTLVRSILRRDPDVLGVAEIPDAATAKELARADHERTRTYAGITADSAINAIINYVRLVGDPELAGKSLHGVVAQKLVRKLCQNCRQPYPPTPDMLKKLGLPPDKVKQLFRKGGQVIIKNKPAECLNCKGTGYFGAEGVFEVYKLGDAERAKIRAGDINGLKAELRKRQLPTIQLVAIRKAVDGTTSVEEVTRITASDAKPEAAPAASSSPPGQAPQPAKKS